jgi:tellurite resistance protein TerC
MRGVMIAVGAELIARDHWILYVFGVFLLVPAVKMLVIREHSDPAQTSWAGSAIERAESVEKDASR